jgi:hypothetical protein
MIQAAPAIGPGPIASASDATCVDGRYLSDAGLTPTFPWGEGWGKQDWTLDDAGSRPEPLGRPTGIHHGRGLSLARGR